MKFLVDAQLPLALAEELRALGHDVRHTRELPDKNETSDSEISRLADSEGRIVISKDGDFVVSHLLSGSPRNLLQINTGNIENSALISMIRRYDVALQKAFEESSFVEINPRQLIVHG
jgi:predicted nuclease of predicted toxin-antitoxin system